MELYFIGVWFMYGFLAAEADNDENKGAWVIFFWCLFWPFIAGGLLYELLDNTGCLVKSKKEELIKK